MAKHPLHRKCASTFYIFPVFLPLAELIPWMLTVIGAAAAGSHVLSRAILRHKYRRAILAAGIACLIAAAGLLLQRVLSTPSAEEGSTMVAKADFSPLTRYHAPPAPPLAAKHLNFALLWSVHTPRQNIGKPSLAGGMLMVGTYNGTVDAYSIIDGQQIWSLAKHEQVFSTPAVSGGMAFVGEGHHTSPASVLTGFAFPGGSPVWERKFRSHVESYPVIDPEHKRLWIGAGEIGLWSLNSETGERLWWNPLGHIDTPVAYTGGKLYAAAKLKEEADGSALFELDPASGKILRSTQVPGNPMCNMLAGPDGTHFLGTAIGQVGVKRETDAGWTHAIAIDGTLRWTSKLPAMPLPEGAVLRNGSMLFYTLNDGSLLALRTHDGSIAWQKKTDSLYNTDVALIEDGPKPRIAAITTDGRVVIRDAHTGDEIRHINVEQGDSYPTYKDGILYITTPYSIRAYAGVAG